MKVSLVTLLNQLSLGLINRGSDENLGRRQLDNELVVHDRLEFLEIFIAICLLLLGLNLLHCALVNQFTVDVDVTCIHNETGRVFSGDADRDDDQRRLKIQLSIDGLVLLQCKLKTCSSLLTNALNSCTSALHESNDLERLHLSDNSNVALSLNWVLLEFELEEGVFLGLFKFGQRQTLALVRLGLEYIKVQTEKVRSIVVWALLQGETASAERCFDTHLDSFTRHVNFLRDGVLFVPVDSFVEFLPLLFGHLCVLFIMLNRFLRL
ncbi:hypothetical protein HG531_013257 [Fusarium graminearum]|nr:hypothetical protein HG531_013257 [Fusarium graminearum]